MLQRTERVVRKALEESFPYLRACNGSSTRAAGPAVSWPKEYGGRSAYVDGSNAVLGRDGARGWRPPWSTRWGLGLIGPPSSPWKEAQRNATFRKILSAEGDLVPGLFGAECGFRSRRFQTEARLDGDHSS